MIEWLKNLFSGPRTVASIIKGIGTMIDNLESHVITMEAEREKYRAEMEAISKKDAMAMSQELQAAVTARNLRKVLA